MTNELTAWLVASPDHAVAGVGIVAMLAVGLWLTGGVVWWWLQRHADDAEEDQSRLDRLDRPKGQP